MGNVPALAYFSSGLLIWIAAGRQRRISPALAAGLLFGFAATTRAQWAIILLPALALTWIVDRTVLGERRTADFAAAGAGTVAVIAG